MGYEFVWRKSDGSSWLTAVATGLETVPLAAGGGLAEARGTAGLAAIRLTDLATAGMAAAAAAGIVQELGPGWGASSRGSVGACGLWYPRLLESKGNS